MHTTSTSVLLGVCCLAFGTMICSAEKTVPRTTLPAAVQKTADEQSQGATVKHYVKDTENGHLEYEVETTLKGHSRDVTIAPDGTLLEVEEQVNPDALPTDVRQGLSKKAGRGIMTKVESITKHGTIVAYEAQVRTAAKQSEIQVGPNGETLNHEE